MSVEPHQHAMAEAIEAEARAYDALLEGRDAVPLLQRAETMWSFSLNLAPPRSFGRAVGMVKAAVLHGEAFDAAAEVRGELEEFDEVEDIDSPTAAYALAIAALVLGADEEAGRLAEKMRGGSDAFDRAADAIEGLATRDEARYAAALRAIVADFEQREHHLTGVAFADTALMLEKLAEPRGMAVHPESPVLP